MSKQNSSLFTVRSCGLLLHITSLPGPHGIGDLGPTAYEFVDFLAASGQRYWQFLPLGPTEPIFGCSPYMGVSAMAGNPLMISLESLVADGLLYADDLAVPSEFSEYHVCFPQVIAFKTRLLEQAFLSFSVLDGSEDFERFCAEEAYWLDDYTLFMAIREQHKGGWNQWPKKLALRKPEALREARSLVAERIDYYTFEQYCFFRQWQHLRDYANKKNVLLVGDLPIYVGYDSVDVWAHQASFQLDPVTLLPTHVAGVPPDYFSATGQRWGNPLYRWQSGDRDNEPLYQWWRARFTHLGNLVDAVRIDHFRGFESYWQIPADEETAVNGKWVKGPGKHFFDEMGTAVDGLAIIAEDLGIITEEVQELRDLLAFPGMKILQFAFDSDEHNLYLPHKYDTTNCVVYTGTHDNNTTVGWFYDETIGEGSKDRVRKYANSNGDKIHWDFIRLALSSTASTAIIPLQDLLGFGADCRMNTPGTVEANWQWRCAARFLDESTRCWYYNETKFYGRVVDFNGV